MAAVAAAAAPAGAAIDLEGEEGGFAERVVHPGDVLTAAIEAVAAGADAGGSGSAAAAPIKLGAGLAPVDEDVLATRSGVLSHKAPARFFVLANHRRYFPAVGDAVVGVVTDRNAEAYRVRLHGTTAALLPVLAFDGATKRNKPTLAIGALVFARVAAVSKHLDVELTCQGACACSSGMKLRRRA